MPKALLDQLALAGKMVIPVGGNAAFYGQSIKLIKKIDQEKFEEENYSGFAFVPLVKK